MWHHITMETKFLEPCKPGVFETKNLEKPGDWNLKPGDFQNMYQRKPKRQIIFVTVFFTLLVGGLCCTLLLFFRQWWKDSLSLSTFMGWRVANCECYKAFTKTLENLCFSGIRLELDSAFPPKLDWNNSSFSRLRFLPESSGNFKIFWFVS